jgi:predicted amidohydrolase YtcJ
MVSKLICFLAVFVGVFCACQKGHAPSGPIGDVVVRKAHIYTVDAQRLQTQAVAIKGDRILWVGDEKDVDAHIGPTTHVMDAGGRLLLPGFIDSHFHVLLGGNRDVLRIENGNTLAEIQRQVREFAIKGPELKWIEVEG